MPKKEQSILEKTYYSVSINACDYFKQTWMQQNDKSESSFYYRLKHPTIEDVILFCQVCKVHESVVLKPLKEKYKNVEPYNSNLQLSIQ